MPSTRVTIPQIPMSYSHFLSPVNNLLTTHKDPCPVFTFTTFVELIIGHHRLYDSQWTILPLTFLQFRPMEAPSEAVQQISFYMEVSNFVC